VPEGTAEHSNVSSIADVCPFAAARPRQEVTAVAAKDAVLTKSLREIGILLSSFDVFMGKVSVQVSGRGFWRRIASSQCQIGFRLYNRL
jgi:hypothetical protein